MLPTSIVSKDFSVHSYFKKPQHMILLFIHLQVLQEVLSRYSIREDLFGKVCIIIDKVSSVILLADF